MSSPKAKKSLTPAHGVGAKLQALRQGAGLSQEDLAERIGAKKQKVSNWERGRFTPSFEKAVLLARALGCSLDSFVDESDAGREKARPMQVHPTSDAVEIRDMGEIPERERQKLVDLFVALVALYRHRRQDFDAAQQLVTTITTALPPQAAAKRAAARRSQRPSGRTSV